MPEAGDLGEETDIVEATVVACIPGFELVMVRTADEFQYALTPATAGISLQNLREGQRVRCVVTRRLRRVIAAEADGASG